MNVDLQTVVATAVTAVAVIYVGLRGFQFFRSGGAGGCSACPSSSCAPEPEQAVHDIQVRMSPVEPVPDGETERVS
ncbi:MAG: hypothetical protein CMJ73_06720 [Planctomycetaceae bacterium]|nr:hypothetical protein [Planctomycetaceae bacterium]